MEKLSTIYSKNIKAVYSALAGLVFIVGTAYAVDERYMKKGDFQQQFQQQQVMNLEDKVFELEYKKQSDTATPLDRTMLERYKSRLKDARGNN